ARAAGAAAVSTACLAGARPRVRVGAAVPPRRRAVERLPAAAGGVSAAQRPAVRARRGRGALGALPARADAGLGGAGSAAGVAPSGGERPPGLPAAVAGSGGGQLELAGGARRHAHRAGLGAQPGLRRGAADRQLGRDGALLPGAAARLRGAGRCAAPCRGLASAGRGGLAAGRRGGGRRLAAAPPAGARPRAAGPPPPPSSSPGNTGGAAGRPRPPAAAALELALSGDTVLVRLRPRAEGASRRPAPAPSGGRQDQQPRPARRAAAAGGARSRPGGAGPARRAGGAGAAGTEGGAGRRGRRASIRRMNPTDPRDRRPQRIAMLAGDGIGKDVTAEAVKVIETAAEGFGLPLVLEHLPWDADGYLATGETLPAGALEDFRDNWSAVFIGAYGDPRVPDMKHAADILLGIRFGLDLYINLRPIKLYDARYCPLKGRRERDVDIVVFRENTEGAYVNIGGNFKRGTADEIAVQDEIHTRKGVERIVRAAFEYAVANGRRE